MLKCFETEILITWGILQAHILFMLKYSQNKYSNELLGGFIRIICRYQKPYLFLPKRRHMKCHAICHALNNSFHYSNSL